MLAKLGQFSLMAGSFPNKNSDFSAGSAELILPETEYGECWSSKIAF